MNNQNILIYQNEQGNIKVDVRFEEEELDKKAVVRNFRTTTKHRAIESKT
ncbi:MAG: hypothetical protein WCY75_12005 [Sulfurimonadaceae bacterium]